MPIFEKAWPLFILNIYSYIVTVKSALLLFVVEKFSLRTFS